MSCDGCSIAVLGATAPKVGDLLTGSLPGRPVLSLHHADIQFEAGEAYVAPIRRAERGTLNAPYVVVMPCTIHVDAGQQAIVREVSTCTCIIEEQEPVSVG
jgi:hydrogenase small subunit